MDEYDVLPADLTVPLELTLPGSPTQSTQSQLWFDVLRLITAQAIASYQGGCYSGTPAITLNNFGKVQSVYVGTLGDDDLHDKLTSWALNAVGLEPVFAAPAGVEAVERWQGERRLFSCSITLTPPRKFGLDKPAWNY